MAELSPDLHSMPEEYQHLIRLVQNTYDVTVTPLQLLVGGWSGAIVSGDLDPRDGTAALGFVNAMADLKDATTKGGSLYVFRLP